MMDIMAFLMANFNDFHACPTGSDLGEILEEAGFDGDKIGAFLLFLRLLDDMPPVREAWAGKRALRLYAADEADALPPQVRALLHFLEREGALNPQQREFVIHALMHLPYGDITVETAKMLAVLVLWAQRTELPVLIGSELAAASHGGQLMH